MKNKKQNTSDLIVDTLIQWGVTHVFGIPGDGVNGIIEALRRRQKDIRFLLVRHEETAALMACGYAKYTGKLGVCVGTAGPGAIHLINGLYDAKMDGAPVLAITGRTSSDMTGSGYQQDVDMVQLFSGVAAYNMMVQNPSHAVSTTDTACRTALARKGVSHLSISIDVQTETLTTRHSIHNIPGHTSQSPITRAIPTREPLKAAADILNSGRKIVILVGHGALGAEAEVEQLAARLQAPVVKSLLGKAVLADKHPYCLGVLGLLGTLPASKAMQQADTLFMIGTSYPYIAFLPKPGQARGVQIDVFPEKIGLRYPVEVGLIGDAQQTVRALLPSLRQNTHQAFLKKMQKEMQAWQTAIEKPTKPHASAIKPKELVSLLSQRLADDALVSIDVGSCTAWAARYINLKAKMKFAVSGNLATMASALPYAIASQVAYPKRQCVAIIGDGAFSMLMGDFATAVQYHLPIKVFILKNNSLNLIRWEQIVALGNPEYAISLAPINFAGFAECCGARGFAVHKPEDLPKTIDAALRSDGPVIVEVAVDEFEPPLPPQISIRDGMHFLESIMKGQPYKGPILNRSIKAMIKKII